jgi:hypothetical protein
MLRIIKKGVEDDSGRLQCTVVDILKPEDEFEIDLSKQAVELIETINHLEKSLKLYPNTVNELWKKIEAYGDERYLKGTDDPTT